jgi:hypothetical protein
VCAFVRACACVCVLTILTPNLRQSISPIDLASSSANFEPDARCHASAPAAMWWWPHTSQGMSALGASRLNCVCVCVRVCVCVCVCGWVGGCVWVRARAQCEAPRAPQSQESGGRTTNLKLGWPWADVPVARAMGHQPLHGTIETALDPWVWQRRVALGARGQVYARVTSTPRVQSRSRVSVPP